MNADKETGIGGRAEEADPGRPEGGPGLHATASPDAPAWTALAFAAVSAVPDTAFGGLPNAGHFGPFSLAVLAAIVAVLFGVITIFRYVDLRDRRSLMVGVAGGAFGIIRLLLYPLLGM